MFSVNTVLFFQTVDTEITWKFRLEITLGGVLSNLLLTASSDLMRERVAQGLSKFVSTSPRITLKYKISGKLVLLFDILEEKGFLFYPV